MRVGIVSPNVLSNVADHSMMDKDSTRGWPFDALAKRASLLFDKLYLTDNLDLTCEIIGGGSAVCNDDPHCGTLRYLVQKGVILTPEDLGYSSGNAFLQANIKGHAARLHKALLAVGNPSNDCLPGEGTYVGQPDIGGFEAHDGTHPRSRRGWHDPQIPEHELEYESLLLRRNISMLREAGVTDLAIVGCLWREKSEKSHAHPAWKVVINQMPMPDTRASWEDVLGFRAEPRTQQLVRRLRRWIRKIVAEEWTSAELEDEIQELMYEYETHLRVAKLGGTTGFLTCLITGAATLAEDVVKLRLERISRLVCAGIDRRAHLLDEELHAPGRELALMPELRRRL